jgi:hypothetical protein
MSHEDPKSTAHPQSDLVMLAAVAPGQVIDNSGLDRYDLVISGAEHPDNGPLLPDAGLREEQGLLGSRRIFRRLEAYVSRMTMTIPGKNRSMSGKSEEGDDSRTDGRDTSEETREDDGFEMPEPTRTFGPVGPPDPTSYRSVPSRADLEDRSLVEAAMAIKDPWGGDTPPLYSPRSPRI